MTARSATRDPEHAPQRMSNVICGHCGGNIIVDNDSSAPHVRCPSCLHRVKVLRSVSRTGEYCGGQSRADLASGSTGVSCGDYGHSYNGTPTVPRPLRRHRHDYRSHPRRAARPATAPAGVLLVASIVTLYILVTLSLGWLRAGG